MKINKQRFNKRNLKKELLTIPNILSFLRLVLIPIIMILYLNNCPYQAAIVLALSGITDIADGYIARHFNMVSDLGKALDPVADKLTQIAVLFCLVLKFPLMLIPFAILIVKEITTAVMSLIVINKTNIVEGADWHGKVTTTLLYLTMTLHIVWYNLPDVFSKASIAVCIVMMTISFILYFVRNIKTLKNKGNK